jgi:Cu-processing system permease protein
VNLALVRKVAGQELTLALRNRWVLAFSVLFGAAALGIAYFGMVTAGYIGLQDFQRTTASLMNLGLYLIPLMALLMGTLSLAAYPEYNELLLTQPFTRTEMLTGKTAGLFIALVMMIAAGLGLPGIVFALSVGKYGFLDYLGLMTGLVFLGAVFLVLAALIGVLTRRKGIAIGVGLIVWFFYIFLYDLIILGSTVILPLKAVKPVLLFALLGNPVDLVRVSVLTLIGGAEIFGPAGRTLHDLINNPWLVMLILSGIILAWIGLPIWLASRIFRTQDI